MVASARWQSVLCVVFLAQALPARAQQAPQQKPLRFAPLEELKRRGQMASIDHWANVKLTLRKISGRFIGQPAEFAVEIHNSGRPTAADASLLVKATSSPGTEVYGLLFGSVANNAKHVVRFQFTPQLPSLKLFVTEGFWDAKSSGFSNTNAVMADFTFEYDPAAPLTDFLPSRRQTGTQPTTLPARLREVPEVSFADSLAGTKVPAGRFHIAGALAKIKHVNQKKIDAYMELMLSKRPDLNGLPFVLSEACRTKGERNEQFAAITKKIRDIQRSRRVEIDEKSLPDFADKQPMEKVAKILQGKGEFEATVQVAALWQTMADQSAGSRLEMVNYLHRSLPKAESAQQALAKLALFTEEEKIRSAALDALKKSRKQDYTDILVNALNYPWPAVSERASVAIAKLGRADLVPQLEEVLKRPDPRAPQTRLVEGKPKTFARELVRINHLRNCMLCHAPALADSQSTGEVPIPGELIQTYYGESIAELHVRFDVTYLRQDFSVLLEVANAVPWPKMQRYDFVVRTRELDEQETHALRKLLPAGAASPYHRAAQAAIAALSRREK